MLGGEKELRLLHSMCELFKLSMKAALSTDSTALLAHVQPLMPLAAAQVLSAFTASSWLCIAAGCATADGAAWKWQSDVDP